MSVWQPIETAPKDGSEVLLYGGHEGVCRVGRWHEGSYAGAYNARKWTCPNCSDEYEAIEYSSVPPTHWMPLPAPPTPATPQPESQVKNP